MLDDINERIIEHSEINPALAGKRWSNKNKGLFVVLWVLGVILSVLFVVPHINQTDVVVV